MSFIYEIKNDGVEFLFEGDAAVLPVTVALGPGFWHRIVSELRRQGKDVGPEDFDRTIQFAYYYYAREELRDKPDRQRELGFSTCSRCGSIVLNSDFDHVYGLCASCRWEDENKVEGP